LSVTINARPPVVHVFDGGDQERKIVAVGCEGELLDGAEVHGQILAPSGIDGSLAGIDSLERPVGRPELGEELQVEAVAAAHIENSRTGAQVTTPLQEPASLQSPANPVRQPELFGGEVEGVIGWGVDAIQLRHRGSQLQVDQPAAAAAHRQELIGTRVILEVGTHRDRQRVIVATDAALHGFELQRTGGIGRGDSSGQIGIIHSDRSHHS
jgi:hypothetical protein